MDQKKYLYEMHLHTSDSSKCGHASAVEQINHYAKLGFAGVVVTDHFYKGNTCIDRNLPWEEWVHAFCQSYERAKAEGEKLGVDVFFGFEYSYHGNDFLIYGMTREMLIEHPEVKEIGLVEFLTLARSLGCTVVHAHPFGEASYIDMIRLLPRLVDGVEVVNASKTDEVNAIANYYAEHYGLAKSAGTDNHSLDRHNLAAVASDSRFETLTQLTDAIRAGEIEIVRINEEVGNEG